MLNTVHPEKAVSSAGYLGIYKATARMNTVSMYAVAEGHTLYLFALTPGFWETAYQFASPLPFSEIVIIPAATNILMISDIWRLLMNLMALKKRVKVVADFKDVNVDVSTVYDGCVNLPHMTDLRRIDLENGTILIYDTPGSANIRHFDITTGTYTTRIVPCMTDELLQKCVCDVTNHVVERLAVPWRFPVFGPVDFSAPMMMEKNPSLKGHVTAFDYSCPEELYEMQMFARKFKKFLEPEKNYMLTSLR